MSSFRPKLGPPGPIFFHWTTEALIYNIPCPSPHPSHPSKLFGTLTKIMSPALPIAASLFLLANNISNKSREKSQ